MAYTVIWFSGDARREGALYVHEDGCAAIDRQLSNPNYTLVEEGVEDVELLDEYQDVVVERGYELIYHPCTGM